jgi:hypothetical protein
MDRASGFLNPHIYIHNIDDGFLLSSSGSTVYNLIRASAASQRGASQVVLAHSYGSVVATEARPL